MFLRIASESNIPSKYNLNVSITNLSKIIKLKNEEKKKMPRATERESNEPIKIFSLENKNFQMNNRNITNLSPLSQNDEISEVKRKNRSRSKKFIFNNIKIISKSSIKIRKRNPYNTNRANISKYYDQQKDNEIELSNEKYDYFQKRQQSKLFNNIKINYQTPNYSRRYEEKDTDNENKCRAKLYEKITSQNDLQESYRQSDLNEIISQMRREKKMIGKFKIINMQKKNMFLEEMKKLEGKRAQSHDRSKFFAKTEEEKRKKEEIEKEEKKKMQEERKKIIEKMRKKLKIRRELEIKEQKKINEIMIQKKLEKEEKRINYIMEVERKKSKRKIIELRKIKQEEIKRKREQEQLRQKKEQEQKEKELEREKRKKIREELDAIIKERIKKKELELLSQSVEIQRQKMEERKERKRELQYYEEMKRLKQQEEEDRIQEFIKQLKLKAEKEKDLELKEEECDDKDSKYKFTLNLLSEYIKQYLNIYESNEISDILETINKIGKLLKKIINYEKETEKKDNFISIQDAIESNNIVLKFLGVLGEEYNKYNVCSIIEKESEDINLIDGIFKVLLSTYCILPKYEIKINSDTFQSNFSEDPKQWVQFINDLKSKISNKFKIPDSKIYIISHRIDLLEFTIVILDNPLINLQRYEKSYKILVRNRSLLEYIKLSPDFFEREFNRDVNDWDKINLKKGGEKYTPPLGWKGFALKVLNKFDNGDNLWLGNEGKEGEWAVAYHGIGKGNVFQKLINIVLVNLKEGQCQLYAGLINSRDKLNKSYIGKGVYLSPFIEEAEKYTEKIKLGERKSYFQFIIMCRVRPDKIRESKGYYYNWILDGNYDCIRPYRILVKES